MPLKPLSVENSAQAGCSLSECSRGLARVQHNSPAANLRIVLDGSEIAELVPGQPDCGMNLRLGEFYWQNPGVTRAVRNTGTTRLEFIEF
jgi:hypothetical protein